MTMLRVGDSRLRKVRPPKLRLTCKFTAGTLFHSLCENPELGAAVSGAMACGDQESPEEEESSLDRKDIQLGTA